jgi:DNA-binding winged helix-turn-helix (wHTH) protein/Tfp pilus assembly protein PilF
MSEKVFYEFSPFLLDPTQRVLLRDGERVPLHPKTFLLLQTLIEADGRIVSKDDLLTAVWPDVTVEESSLTKNVSLLRKALDNGAEAAELIETISKVGYRFIAPFKLIEGEQASAMQRHVQARRLAAAEPDEIQTETIPLPLPNSDYPGSAEPRRPLKWKLLLSSAALLLVIIAAGGWLLWSRRAPIVAVPAKSTSNPELYQAYVKGRALCEKRTAEGFQQGIASLNQTMEKDPRNALALTALSNCYQFMAEGAGNSMAEMFERATRAALKAVELDENLAEAQAQLGFLEMGQWHVASAERRLRLAVELNPNLAETHARYSIVLLAQGRFEEALAEARRGQELDPSSAQTRMHQARGLYMSRRYEEAIAQCREYVRLDPEFATAHLYLGLSHFHNGEPAKALLPLRQAVKASHGRGETKAALAQTHARLGQKDEALQLLDELKAQASRNMQENYYVASVYAAMGDQEQAFAWLEKAWQQRHPAFATRFKIDPNLDPLRSDPRYADLLRRTGLSQ